MATHANSTEMTMMYTMLKNVVQHRPYLRVRGARRDDLFVFFHRKK